MHATQHGKELGQLLPSYRSVSRRELVAHEFFRLLHASCKQERRPEFYAGKLCVTAKYLSKLLKEIMGLSLYYWITEFSLKEAKILLKSSDLSITQISEELNYPNSSFFARFFKKKTGMSPTRFRDTE